MSTEPTIGLLMVVSARGICAACGHEERAPGPDLYALMLAHAETCEQHPLRQRLVAAEAKAAEWEATAENWRRVNHRNVDAVDASEARAKALAEALQDVVDTESGAYEHFDGHCTPETECCAGHVARVLAAYREATG